MARQCADFEGLFNALAYYGFVEKADAHCYRVEATIEEGSYVLAAAMILLALLNSFVTRATFHYFWDKDSAHKMSTVSKQADPEDAPFEQENDDEAKKLRPPPILFTDSFRWLLRREHLGDRPVPASLRVEQHPEAHTPSSHDHLSLESVEEVAEDAISSEVVPLNGHPPSLLQGHYSGDQPRSGRSEAAGVAFNDDTSFEDDVEA